MSMLVDLLTLPVSGPIRGLIWIAERLIEEAEHEMYDESAVRAKLVELEQHFDLDEMSEEEYLAAEEDLLAQMRVIRKHNVDVGREA